MDAEAVSSVDLAGLTELVFWKLLIWLLIRGRQETAPVWASPEVCLDALSVWQLFLLRTRDTCELTVANRIPRQPQVLKEELFW